MNYMAQLSATYGMDPNQFISMLDQQGQIGQVVEEVRRRKALAGVLETASIVDTQGNPVDLSALEDDEEADDEQAEAILAMQLRRLAALERQKIVDELAEIEEEIADLKHILAHEERQRQIVHDELEAIVEKYGDERRTEITFDASEMDITDLIAEEDVVVTITRTGYAKRTKTDLYRAQKRGGKGVRGAALRGER